MLEPGRTCWRRERADRFAGLMENAAYFAALEAALSNARRSVMILGWQFDPRTRLNPESRIGDRQAEIGHRLRMMVKENQELDVRLLLWKSPLLIAASQGFFPQRGQRWFRKRMADFRLDHPGPLGACHHQKVVVIDDRLAFCGGGDIAVDRWDSPDHFDADPRRCMPSGVLAPPRHEVMAMVDGRAALALGDLARARWARATGERTRPARVEEDPWPEWIEPDLVDVEVGIARTEPGRGRRRDVRENEALHLESIARARRLIYLENQYFTSPVIAAALAARLAEPDGPEVVVVSTGHSPSWFDSMTMDPARAGLLRRLEAADVHGRFSAFSPRTAGGAVIIVHSKVTIIDDELLRIGSTNLNNRGLGFDTECDVMAAPTDVEGPAAIGGLRRRLLAHFLGVDVETYAAAEAREGGVGAAIRSFGPDRLRPLDGPPPSGLARLLGEWQIGDPCSPDDSWMPWKRLRAADVLPAPSGDQLEIDDQRQVV